MKKLLKGSMFFTVAFMLSNATIAAVPENIGSIARNDVQMYAQGGTGGDIATPKTYKINFKIVTLDGKSFAWIKTDKGLMPGAAEWAAQLRYWSASNAKEENNLTIKDAVSKEIMGTATKALPSPMRISFFLDIEGFSESTLFDYNPTTVNMAAETAETIAPVITNCTITPAEVYADMSFEGNDNSGDLFYYIEDATHNIGVISLSSNYRLTGLKANTSYNFTITPIDFSGNKGTSITKQITTKGLVQITSGIAKEVKFMLKSSVDELEYFVTTVDPNQQLRDVALKITPVGEAEFELKPILSADKKSAYLKTNDSRISNKAIALNLCYFIYVEGAPIWENYVMDNKIITSGSNNGSPIIHTMGIAPAKTETELPTITAFSIAAQSASTIQLHIEGNDNSNEMYYEITGGKESVHFFNMGNLTDYIFTSFENGKIYELTAKAYDLSGNISNNQMSVKFRTQKLRSALTPNMIVNTGTLTGEQVIFDYTIDNANMLTVSIKNNDTRLAANSQNVLIQSAQIEGLPNGNRVMIVDADKHAAHYTFPNPVSVGELIGKMRLQWIYKEKEEDTGATARWTNEFLSLIVGDMGGEDTEVPTTPTLTISNNTISWTPCDDRLSGVKMYEIVNNGITSTIYDLGETTFTYNTNSTNGSTNVTAIDFAGNRSETASISNNPTSTNQTKTTIAISVVNKQLNIRGINVATIAILSTSGATLLQGAVINDLSTLNSGIYLLKITDTEGATTIHKIIL